MNNFWKCLIPNKKILWRTLECQIFFKFLIYITFKINSNNLKKNIIANSCLACVHYNIIICIVLSTTHLSSKYNFGRLVLLPHFNFLYFFFLNTLVGFLYYINCIVFIQNLTIILSQLILLLKTNFFGKLLERRRIRRSRSSSPFSTSIYTPLLNLLHLLVTIYYTTSYKKFTIFINK